MSMLIAGATGTVGTQIIENLKGRVSDLRALTRNPAAARFPDGVTAVKGDASQLDEWREALVGVDTLFLLAPGVADELTQTMQALLLAHEAGVKGIVYLSVFQSERFTEVPHFAGKYTVERMIEALGLPVTVLRPAYFMQNDLRQKDPMLNMGAYLSQIGTVGVSMVDVRDIAEAAAIELLRRHASAHPLPATTYDLVGPRPVTGPDAAAIWGKALGREIRYGGDDLPLLETTLKTMLPGWHALDLRLMFGRYQSGGALATAGDVERFTQLLGHAPRSYEALVGEAVEAWGGVV